MVAAIVPQVWPWFDAIVTVIIRIVGKLGHRFVVKSTDQSKTSEGIFKLGTDTWFQPFQTFAPWLPWHEQIYASFWNHIFAFPEQ